MTSSSPVASLLDPAVTGHLDEHHRVFMAEEPFRRVVIDRFLRPEVCQRLVAQFPPFDEEKARNELGVVGRKCTHPNVRALGDAYAELDAFIKSREFLSAIERITGIEDLRYDPHYVGGGTHENLSGQGLDPHVDFNYHPATRQHRRLNLILYLNSEWEEAWGGAIQFHSDPWNPDEDDVETVLPLMNRCVLFETNEHSWHGFASIAPGEDGRPRSRKSFAIYLYTVARPVEETVAPHDTFYVHAPLPGHLVPGATLTEKDCRYLRALLAARNRWMRHLYDRELEYRGEIERFKQRFYYRMLRRVGRVVAPIGSRRRRSIDRWLGKL